MVKKFLEFVVYLPTSKTLSYWWNFGSILGMLFGVQLLTGILLVFYYGTDVNFDSVQYIMYDVNWGWLVRVLHFNGASFFFIFMYFHVFKGFFYGSYRMTWVWIVGVIMMLIFMGVGFMGYVLVNAQMSYWAAVVITSLMTVIPWVGVNLVYFIWGGYSVVSLTIKFFFVMHFLLPWFCVILIMLHLLFLHCIGSSSLLFCFGGYDKISFFPYYWLKDFIGVLVVVFLCIFSCFMPFVLGDVEMFVEANVLSSPVHIAPEWYFLFMYAILRAVPWKLLGVMSMFFSVIYLGVLVVFKGISVIKYKFMGGIYVFVFFSLTWLGANAPEMPFLVLSQCFTLLYFFIITFVVFIMVLSWIIFSYEFNFL